MNTREAAEDDAHCFQKLKCIVLGIEAEIYMGKFNFHSEFCAAWRKLHYNFLKDMLA